MNRKVSKHRWIVMALAFSISFSTIIYFCVSAAPVLPEKPKPEFDWPNLWKDVSGGQKGVSMLIEGIPNPNNDDLGVDILFVDGNTECRVASIAFFPANKSMNCYFNLSETLLDLKSAPSENAKIVLRDNKGKTLFPTKITITLKDLKPRERNEDD